LNTINKSVHTNNPSLISLFQKAYREIGYRY
jgi:hypothetical protein